jgi:hypothetical protein
MIIAPTIVMILIMVGAAFAYVMLTRKTRKKNPDIENQTTKRCPYRDCNWWIIFKDLNNEVRQLYREHLEMHKTTPLTRFEDIEGNWLLENQLQLLEKSVATGTKRDR